MLQVPRVIFIIIGLFSLFGCEFKDSGYYELVDPYYLSDANAYNISIEKKLLEEDKYTYFGEVFSGNVVGYIIHNKNIVVLHSIERLKYKNNRDPIPVRCFFSLIDTVNDKIFGPFKQFEDLNYDYRFNIENVNYAYYNLAGLCNNL